jgi:hypothetical protein
MISIQQQINSPASRLSSRGNLNWRLGKCGINIEKWVFGGFALSGLLGGFWSISGVEARSNV